MQPARPMSQSNATHKSIFGCFPSCRTWHSTHLGFSPEHIEPRCTSLSRTLCLISLLVRTTQVFARPKHPKTEEFFSQKSHTKALLLSVSSRTKLFRYSSDRTHGKSCFSSLPGASAYTLLALVCLSRRFSAVISRTHTNHPRCILSVIPSLHTVPFVFS